MLERRVEVDVVGDLDRQLRVDRADGDELHTRLDELLGTGRDVLPDPAAKGEERVERGRLEGGAEPGGGEVEHTVAGPEADARLVAVTREDAESDHERGSSQRDFRQAPSARIRWNGLVDPCRTLRA